MSTPEQPVPAADDPYGTTAEGRTTVAAGRFRVLRLHARGNLGEVFLAHDTELRREVALKEIQPRRADDPESRRRFLVEAEVTGRLEHPGIVPVYSLGEHPDGRPFYAMRFIRGRSLLEAVYDLHGAEGVGSSDGEARTLRLRRLLRSFVLACHAIDYAHTRGVTHRDLKPHNIMLGTHGETVVVDWGLAKVAGADGDHGRQAAVESLIDFSSLEASDLTATGSLVGTPAYMSPEQAAGRVDLIGPASDVYSLGATLYHLLAGRPAFRGETVAQVLENVVAGRFPPVRAIQPRVSRGLEAIVAKAMATSPADRYATAAALADDLDHWLADQPFAAYAERPVERIFRWVRRHRAWAVAGFTALAITAIVSLVAVELIDTQRRVASRLAKDKTALAESERKALDLAVAGIHRARAGELAALSRAIRDAKPELGILLAVEGIQTTRRAGLPIVPAAEESLREALTEIGGVPFRLLEPVLALSGAGRWLVCESQFFDMDAIDPAGTGQPHGVPAVVAACSDDESRLALLAADGSVTVIDPTDAVRRPIVITAPGGPVVPGNATLRLSPDGRWLYVALAADVGRLLDLKDPATAAAGAARRVVAGRAATALFSPDSRRLAIQAEATREPVGSVASSASDRDTVHVWQLDDARAEPVALAGGPDHRPLAFAPEGGELVTRDGVEDSRVRLCDLAVPGRVELIAAVPGEATAIFQPRTGRLVLTERKGLLKGWRLMSRRQDGGWQLDHVTEVDSPEDFFAVACSDTWLVASFSNTEILCWNLAEEVGGVTHSDLPDRHLRGHRHRVTAMAFSRDGRRLVSVGKTWVRSWDFSVSHPEVINQTLAARPGTLLARPDAPVGGATGERVMSPDGGWLAIDGEDATVRVLDLSLDDPMRHPIELVGHGGKVVFHTFSPDGRWLATGGADHTVCVWDLAELPRGGGAGPRTARPVVKFPTDGLDPACLRFGAEPGQLWVAGPVAGDGAIDLWEWSPARPDSATRRARITGIAVSPRLAFRLGAGELTVAMHNGGVERHRLQKGVPTGPPEAVADGMAAIVPASTWTGRGTGPFATSPDGRWRTRAAGDGEVELVRIGSEGREVTTRLLHDRDATFQCAVFSGDSALLATGFSDGGLQIWNLRAEDVARSVMSLRGHMKPVEFIEFDRSDRWLVSSSSRSIRLWEMDAARLIAMARKTVGRELTDSERVQFGIDATERPESAARGGPGP